MERQSVCDTTLYINYLSLIRTFSFFFGKNKVMAIGLGRTKETEYKDNLHKLSNRLYGQCGLLFTNRPRDEVLR